MATHKRPALRPCEPRTIGPQKPSPGSFLHSICYPPKTEWCKDRLPSHFYLEDPESYLKALEKSCIESGAVYKKPDVRKTPPYKSSNPVKYPVQENLLDYVFKLHVLKNGKIRIKLLTSMASLQEKYYIHGKIPPRKALLSAMKSMGYDKEYIEKLKNKMEKRAIRMEKNWENLEKLFEKPSVSRKKKKKEEEVLTEVNEEITPIDEEDQNEENEENEEDGEMDIDNNEEEEEIVEEEYISDGE